MVCLFWVSVLFIVYSYFGYPAILWILSRMRRDDGRSIQATPEGNLPRVSLLISAHNEEKVIGDKILNALTLNYPNNLLEIVVLSDGSTDNTDEIVKQYGERGVVLRRFEGRIGKTACLNNAVPLSRGEIVVFSDANSMYERDALRELVIPFRDENIGFVTGLTRYTPAHKEEAADAIGLYSRIELYTKRFESMIGSCVGADGAIFAIRKKLYRQLKSTDINDLVIPLMIIKQGCRGVLSERAVCYERAANERGEFSRQIRVANRTIRALVANRDLFNPFRYGLFSFQLFSHKVCKLVVPFFLMILLAANISLFSSSFFFAMTMFGQLFIYLLSLSAGFSSYMVLPSRMVTAIRTFVVVNCAILFGWLQYFRGETYTQWSVTR